MKKVVLFFVCVLALFTACKKDEPVSDKIEEIKFDSEMYEVFEYDTLDLRSKLQILPAFLVSCVPTEKIVSSLRTTLSV